MRKRTYRAVPVKQVDEERLRAGAKKRLILGCDAAKEIWYGAWMNEEGEVLQTIRWDVVEDSAAVVVFVQQLTQAGLQVEVAVEPTGTYADAFVAQLLVRGTAVYRVNAKHAHDYEEIYDGVPSGHDAKAAAIVAKLHLERGSQSRRWRPLTQQRRELRAFVDELDWLKQDELRILNRIESRLARHWPELSRLLGLTSVSAIELLATYGGPAAVAADASGVQQSLRRWSHGSVRADKRGQGVASAATTLGVPMLEAERTQVEQLARTLRALRHQRRAADRRLAQHTAADPYLASLSTLVGVTTASVLYARLGDLRDYGSVRALCRAPGLNLREQSSGKKKGRLTITKRGSAVARRWLFLATLRWLKADRIARAWYDRKVRGNGGVKLKAVIALMRKLLAALYHVARGIAYDPRKLFDCRRLQLAVA